MVQVYIKKKEIEEPSKIKEVIILDIYNGCISSSRDFRKSSRKEG